MIDLNKFTHWILILIGITPMYLMYIGATMKEQNKEVVCFYKEYFNKMEKEKKLSKETVDVLRSLKQDLKSSKSVYTDSMAEVFNNAMDLAVTFVDEHLQGHCNVIKEYETVGYVLRFKDIQIDDNGLKNINNLITSRQFWAERFMKCDLREKVKCYASMMYCDIQLKALLNIQDYE